MELFEEMDDAHLLALTGWREARGDGAQGITAVMSVILNRIGYPDFAATLREVILGRNQFTSFSPNDPEYRLYPPNEDEYFEAMVLAAQQMLIGNYEDITLGAHFYANLGTMDKNGWFKRNIVDNPDQHPFTVKLGHHSFFL